MTLSALFSLPLCLLLAGGCRTSHDAREDTVDDGSYVVSGTMEFINIETGCWILVADDGRRYEPSGERAGPLWKDGLRVTVRVRPLRDVASVCQAGMLVEIQEVIESREQ